MNQGEIDGGLTPMEKRSARRRARMVGHRAASFEDAERWDLQFWQDRTPQERLSALVAIHRDIQAIGAARIAFSENADG